jgi:predicted signal transduction protein with EAL and GGDEF domain
VRNADTALFRAKEIGRDNYAFFTERMDAEIRDKLAIQASCAAPSRATNLNCTTSRRSA